jgi:serine/threonine-protein kinase RIO1
MTLRRSTAAQVLFKMLNQGVFSSINGCISTGKEANVYHAVTSEGNHLAVKVCARAWDAMGGGS